MEKISPRVDIAFKKIFGVEENKDLLISLINSIVGEEDQVVTVTLLNPYNPKSFKQDKLSILDIKAENQEGKRYNIEIQISDDADYDKRALYYWAKLYTGQLKATENYAQLSKAIGIHILNFMSIPHVEKYHNVFNIREKDSSFAYFKDLELHTIELKKFAGEGVKALSDVVARVRTSLDMWVAFLTRHDLLNVDPLPRELNNPALQKALTVLAVMNFGPEEREDYEARLKWLWVEENTLKKYETKGYEEGLEKGEQVGLEKGLEKGKIEEKIEIARKMRAQGMDTQTIIALTGLPASTLDSL